MMKKGFTIVELLAVIAIIAIIGVIAVPGYHYIVNQVQSNMYDNKLNYVKIAAENFAFETGLTVTNIAHLIEVGKLEADNEEGDYRNPLTNANMLCQVVRISHDEHQYHAIVTEQEVCDYDQLAMDQNKIYINRFDENGEALFTSSWNRGWTKGSVRLQLALSVDFNYPDEVKEIRWISNDQEEVVEVNHDFFEKREYVVEASQLVNTSIEAQVTFYHEGKDIIYRTSTMVMIDRQAPSLYQDDILVSQPLEWTYESKDVSFTMSDGNGSGVYGYAIVRDDNRCHFASYTKTDKLTVTRSLPAGKYYICVKDYAGNFSEEFSSYSFVIDRIDGKAPNIQYQVEQKWGAKNVASFTIIDPDSGVIAYSLGPDNVFEDWHNVDCTSEFSFQEEFTHNGIYYIYAKDAVGNISKQSFAISYVDVTAPQIKKAEIIPVDGSYGLTIDIHIEATDETALRMCVSTLGYGISCEWEEYNSMKRFHLSESLDERIQPIYVLLRDIAGNETKQEFQYEVYPT
ncbi:MAG: prepilin-type N-terminal cleavage/methylation domain-containing protein [Bacilli bacterium]|nr:prepilin-type N-terminal cleavage/methylation domain-containing protein [Bacilli bacterium]